MEEPVPMVLAPEAIPVWRHPGVVPLAKLVNYAMRLTSPFPRMCQLKYPEDAKEVEHCRWIWNTQMLALHAIARRLFGWPRRPWASMGEVCCREGHCADAAQEEDFAGSPQEVQLPVQRREASLPFPMPKQRTRPKRGYQDSPPRWGDFESGRSLGSSCKSQLPPCCLHPVRGATDGRSLHFLRDAQPILPVKAFQRRRPDFTGHWLCWDTSGDMQALMVALEVPWAKRTAAQLINYGVGVARRRIHHAGDDFAIACLGTPAEFEQRFRVGGGSQTTEGPNGDAMVLPSWEQGRILRVVQSELDGSSPSTWRQFMAGEELVVEMIACTGESASWRFKRSEE